MAPSAFQYSSGSLIREFNTSSARAPGQTRVIRAQPATASAAVSTAPSTTGAAPGHSRGGADGGRERGQVGECAGGLLEAQVRADRPREREAREAGQRREEPEHDQPVAAVGARIEHRGRESGAGHEHDDDLDRGRAPQLRASPRAEGDGG